MMRIVIVDDEPHCSETLAVLLRQGCAHLVSDILTFNKPEEALQHLLMHGTDVLLLDVQMPRLTGFQLIEQLGRNDFQLIFCTAFDQFAVEAFRASAIDYLLKPIRTADLQQAMRKAFEQFRQAQQSNAPAPVFDKFPVTGTDGIEFVPATDILYATADSNYTTLQCANQKYVLSKTLKEVEQKLAPLGFERIHNSHLANIKHITHYARGAGGAVTMSNGHTLPVSKSRKAHLLQALGAGEA